MGYRRERRLILDYNQLGSDLGLETGFASLIAKSSKKIAILGLKKHEIIYIRGKGTVINFNYT